METHGNDENIVDIDMMDLTWISCMEYLPRLAQQNGPNVAANMPWRIWEWNMEMEWILASWMLPGFASSSSVI